MLISYLKEYFRKKSALEKLDPANRFSEDLGLFPTETVWCTASPFWPVKCTIVLNVLYKGSWCRVHLFSARPCVESHGVEMFPSLTQAAHPPPPKPL
jgi:hypothetical protein